MSVEKKSFEFKIETLTEKGEFLGYASVFDVVDQTNELVERGAFTKTIQERKQFPLLWNHQIQDVPLGSVIVKEDERGLRVWGKLRISSQKASEIYELMKEGVVRGLSIGYKVIKDAYEGGVRKLKELKLYEVSLTPFPANEEAVVDEVKAEWSTAFINSLPDEAFAVIEPAYKRGETENKNARHLPHHNKNVKDPDDDETVDLPHLRNALARVNQIKPVTDSISREELIRKATKHLVGHAKRLGIGEHSLSFWIDLLKEISIENLDEKMKKALSESFRQFLESLEPSEDTQERFEPSEDTQIKLAKAELKALIERIKKL